MEVVAKPMQNQRHKSLHWDFLTETCRSFDVDLHKSGGASTKPRGNVIALRHDKGELLHETALESIDTVLIGCDDSGDDDWMEGYRAVRIATPNDYFLWSGVALGIFLHHYQYISRAT